MLSQHVCGFEDTIMKPERIKSVPAFMFYKHKHIKGEHMEFYQLKITRKGTKPPIWRRCLIPADTNFGKMAEMLQDILEYQIAKFIGGYMVALGGCNAIVFTAGLGENQASHRMAVGKYLSYLGVKIDEALNEEMIHGREGKISAPDSSIEVYVIPTNEELVIARDTRDLVEKL